MSRASPEKKLEYSRRYRERHREEILVRDRERRTRERTARHVMRDTSKQDRAAAIRAAEMQKREQLKREIAQLLGAV